MDRLVDRHAVRIDRQLTPSRPAQRLTVGIGLVAVGGLRGFVHVGIRGHRPTCGIGPPGRPSLSCPRRARWEGRDGGSVSSVASRRPDLAYEAGAMPPAAGITSSGIGRGSTRIRRTSWSKSSEFPASGSRMRGRSASRASETGSRPLVAPVVEEEGRPRDGPTPGWRRYPRPLARAAADFRRRRAPGRRHRTADLRFRGSASPPCPFGRAVVRFTALPAPSLTLQPARIGADEDVAASRAAD